MPANKIIVKIHGNVQYYSAKLNIEAKFSGLKYYIHSWFYISSLLITAWLSIIIYLLVLTSFYDLRSLFFSNKSKMEEKDKNIVNSLTGELKKFDMPNDKVKQDLHLKFKENLLSFKEYLNSQ